ncbi:MAG: hypothetical protein Q9170_000277 [Blastenia crenularia]
MHEDHNHQRLLNILDQHDEFQGAGIGAHKYEPEFAVLDRGIIGRAPGDITTLENNAPQPMDIDQGDIQYWMFPNDIIQGPYGSSDLNLPLNITAMNRTCLENDLAQLTQTQNTTGSIRNVSLTISTCDQPTWKAKGAPSAPSQLEVYVSVSTDNQKPDKGRSDSFISVDDGYGTITLPAVSGDVWVGVRAPSSNDFEGAYKYELAASIDAPYAAFFEGRTTPWDAVIAPWDTDAASSLLVTGNITNAWANSSNFAAWMDMKHPFSVYVNKLSEPGINGLSRSVCGLKTHAQIKTSTGSMVKIGGQPKQLFYVAGLDNSSHYDMIMTLEPLNNRSIGGGGAVWGKKSFTTKSDNNCQVIHSLQFCTDVAYAVPTNLSFMTNMTGLASIYDDYAHDSYQNFNKSLQQIPCETTPSAQYSLARTCQDCDNAYKTWLCAVTIPRCADFSSPPNLTYLMPRNINAQKFVDGKDVIEGPIGSIFSKGNRSTKHFGDSRNPMIDEQIKPGPYKEILPFMGTIARETRSGFVIGQEGTWLVELEEKGLGGG